MEQKWFHRVYVYDDGVAYKRTRREIVVHTPTGEEVSVGGAFPISGEQIVAFICPRGDQRKINTLDDVLRLTQGRYVFGATLLGALRTLKWKYPNPEALLIDDAVQAMASF